MNMNKYRLLWILILCTGSVMATSLNDLEEVNFPLNSHVVVDAYQGLEVLAEVMKKHPELSLTITGYTDSSGTKPYNAQLATKRAESVKAHLLQMGVASAQIEAIGFGKEHYKADNTNREGRFINRRCELTLYEQVNGQAVKVSVPRLMELFLGKENIALIELPEKVEKVGVAQAESHESLLQKLNELQAGQEALKQQLAAEKTTNVAEENVPSSRRVTVSAPMGQYGSVSVDAGDDDYDEFSWRVRGDFFRPLTASVALQARGEWYESDWMREGGLDAAMVYQQGMFKAGAVLSGKHVSQEGWDSAFLGQGALVVNLQFEKGHIGAFATAGFSDGDVVLTEQMDLTYTRETYLQVVDQVGLQFGVVLGNAVLLSGSAASLDTDLGADTSFDLNVEWWVKDNWSLYLTGSMNRNLITNEDNNRYALGFRLGQWRYRSGLDQNGVTPIDIPTIKYEVLTRMMRTGNTAPVAEAGANQTEVAEGLVTLDGSASYDPEGDSLSYTWVQTAGTLVELEDAHSAVASFMGVAGQAYTFMLTVRDTYGETSSDLVHIVMEEAEVELLEPMIAFFTATPRQVLSGDLVNLHWQTQYADTVSIEPMGQVNPSGSTVIQPRETVVLVLTATNAVGSVSETVTIEVTQPEVEEPNTFPIAVAGRDQFRGTEGVVMLDGSYSFDPDGDTLSYRWIVIYSTQPITLSDPTSPTPSFEAQSGSNYLFRLVVTDGRGGIDQDDVLVKVF
jgi:hypothetical protein